MNKGRKFDIIVYPTCPDDYSRLENILAMIVFMGGTYQLFSHHGIMMKPHIHIFCRFSKAKAISQLSDNLGIGMLFISVVDVPDNIYLEYMTASSHGIEVY